MTRTGKIVIWATVLESYRFIIDHPRALLRIGWLPLCAFFLLNLVFDTFSPGPSSFEPAVALPELGRVLANILAQTTIAAVILVAWHRIVILGPDHGPGLLALALGLREMRYLFAWLLLSVFFLLLVLFSFALVVAIGFAILLGLRLGLTVFDAKNLLDVGGADQFMILELASIAPAVLLATYFASRLSLILPAVATDRRRSLRRAWSLSTGNGWRLALASILVMLPIECISISAAFAASNWSGTLLYYPAAFAAAFSLLLLIVATGTVLSLFSLELEQCAGVETRASTAPDAGPLPLSIR